MANKRPKAEEMSRSYGRAQNTDMATEPNTADRKALKPELREELRGAIYRQDLISREYVGQKDWKVSIGDDPQIVDGVLLGFEAVLAELDIEEFYSCKIDDILGPEGTVPILRWSASREALGKINDIRSNPFAFEDRLCLDRKLTFLFLQTGSIRHHIFAAPENLVELFERESLPPENSAPWDQKLLPHYYDGQLL